MKDFPQEVIDKMLERQEEQTGKRDLDRIKENPRTDKKGGVFTWKETPEGQFFWVDVIVRKDFDVFFNKYPKVHSHGLKVYFETDGYSELFCTFEREEDYDLLHKEIVKIAKSKNFTRVTESWE